MTLILLGKEDQMRMSTMFLDFSFPEVLISELFQESALMLFLI